MGAVLFSGSHEIGTRAGAVAVSRDIRLTGGGRLRRVDAVPKPSSTARLDARWITIERRLVAVYASTYLRIWDQIDRARTQREKARLPRALWALIDAPHELQHRAGVLEQLLHAPDCTGGEPQQPQGRPPGPRL